MTRSDVRRAADEPDGFRPDLEGLRAVAVVLVLLYHASVPHVTGGYVGVDVFFVLSGFLITGLLLREVRRTGTISLTSFYARRARRLLPASALVLLVTVILSAMFMPPLRVPDVAGDAASAALYVSNIHFALQATDYLQAELAPSPILHFWSLSVEEQFYFFWPAIVLLVVRFARGRADFARWIAAVAGVIVLVSFGVAIWLTEANAPWAFFSLLTRAWELGLGAFLAIGATQLARIPAATAATMAWIGLALIALSGVLLTTATPYPGTAALLPTVGSALVIAGGFRQSSLAPGRLLSMAVPRFLGRISYSLYLWHWPLLVIPAAALDSNLPWWARGGLVALSIGCAWATQRWVESPFRHGRWIGMLPRRNLAMAGALTLVVTFVSLGIGTSSTNALRSTVASDPAAAEAELDAILGRVSPMPGATASLTPGTSARPTASSGPGLIVKPDLPATVGGPVPDDLRPSIVQARDDHPAPYNDGCHATGSLTDNGPCVYADTTSSTTIVLMGDSHALAWFPAVERMASAHGWRFVDLTKGECAVADVAQWSTRRARVFNECGDWREKTFKRIQAEGPALVLLSSSRSVSIVDGNGTILTGTPRTREWKRGMAATLARLTPIAGHVVLIGDTPHLGVDLPVCLSAHRDDSLACSTPFDAAVNVKWLNEEQAAATRGGAGFIDPTAWVCPSDPCPAVIGKYMVMFDAGHMSVEFASALYQRLGDAVGAITGLH